MENIDVAAVWVVFILVILGKILKESTICKNKFIPLILSLISILVCILIYFSKENTMSGILFGIKNGILCCGVAVYGNQIFKQVLKDE